MTEKSATATSSVVAGSLCFHEVAKLIPNDRDGREADAPLCMLFYAGALLPLEAALHYQESERRSNCE
jgi:hypothetical protein